MQTTKKRNCPATITIREFEVFPEYGYSLEEIEQMSDYAFRKLKLQKLESLRSALVAKQPVKTKLLYHVSLPSESAHTGHKCGVQSGMAQRMHPMISQKIVQLVREGATDVQEVKRVLREYVKSEFKENCPDQINRSYFPTTEDICNHIYLAKQGLEFSKFDQDNLSAKVKHWKVENQDSFHFFRPYLVGKVVDDESNSPSQSLLWVHQEKWQRTMLCTYGNCVTLIDATYKTMRYDLPLFFVCVRTNVGYCVTAEFVTQSETAETIQEALQILKSWNPEWNPPFVLCDYSEAEISAIEHTFPGISVFLCDFHREQAWTRWVNTSVNGLSKAEAEDLLSLLRKCAWTPSSTNKDCPIDGYVKAVKDLKESSIYKNHSNVRSWLESNWLNIPEVIIYILCIKFIYFL